MKSKRTTSNLNLPRYIDSQQAEDLQDIEGHLRGVHTSSRHRRFEYVLGGVSAVAAVALQKESQRIPRLACRQSGYQESDLLSPRVTAFVDE